MISLAAAEHLARCGWNVIHISAGMEPGNVYIPEEGTGSITDLFRNFEEEELSERELEDAMTECRGVRILPGLRSRQAGILYMPGALAGICRVAASSSDYVIIDGGCIGDNCPGQEALQFAGQVYAVATQQEKTLMRWKQKKKRLQCLAECRIRYIVNKFNGSGAFYTEEQLAQHLDCSREELIAIPYVPYGWQAESEHTTLLKFRRFRKGISSLTEYIRQMQMSEEKEGEETGV